MKIFFKPVILALFTGVFSYNINAQSPDPLNSDIEVNETVLSIAQRLEDLYVLEDTAVKYAEKLRTELNKGSYSQLKNPEELIEKLQEDLAQVYHDGHLSISFDPEFAKLIENREKRNDTSRIINEAFIRKNNAGFKKVEILNGNIGYLKLDVFVYLTDVTAEIAENAMDFLSNSDALIIDLRENMGGSPTMIKHLLSYFFSRATHYNDFYDRSKNSKTEHWTSPVQVSAFTEMPVYILTSSSSFSAAEEFAYDFQQLGRGVVIGEATGGGAHPVRPFSAENGYIVNIPFARAINPISGSNWERTGVIPDIPIDADRALYKATEVALEHLISRSKDTEDLTNYRWFRTINEAYLYPFKTNESQMNNYSGIYEEIDISFWEGKLWYTDLSNSLEAGTYNLLPLAEDEFLPEGFDDLMIRFNRDQNGKVVGLSQIWSRGEENFLPKG